ncbi:MAG: PIG-L family deacetylase, partial [Candidatus Poribacteria bacterium]|nr:PIG-L family deacetylase [Candidatus Poribacteria bacterium]
VPNICPFTPHLDDNPVIVYTSDGFTKPYPFKPDVVVGIDDVLEKKLDMLHCHESQMYEWLPYNAGILNQVPTDATERRKWMSDRRSKGFMEIADTYRALLIELYGEAQGGRMQYAEAFEGCEYGSPLTDENKRVLFPFFPEL